MKSISAAVALLMAAVSSSASPGTLNGPGEAQNPPLRLALAGLVHGHVAGMLENAVRRKDIDLAGIAEPDTALSAAYQKKFGLPATLFFTDLGRMLDERKPEAVAIFSSTYDHRAIVEACSRRGIHVMMEKPLAVSLKDAVAIRRAARRGHIQVLVNYETTWYPGTGDLYRAVRRDGFGAIRRMVAHDGHQGPKEIGVGPEFLRWLTDPVLDGGGALMDFGCYGANLFTYLMDNQRPLSVSAVTLQIKPLLYPRVDDDATIILTYPHAVGIIEASWNWPFGRKDLEIYGAAGSALTIGRTVLRLRIGEDPEKEVTSNPVPAPEDDPLSYLSAVVRRQLTPAGPSSLENNMIVSEILDAARRSAAGGRAIRLPRVAPEDN